MPRWLDCNVVRQMAEEKISDAVEPQNIEMPPLVGAANKVNIFRGV